LRKQGRDLFRSSERKLLRKILCPALDNGCWRSRKNYEICKVYDERDVVKFIKLGREEVETEKEADGS
jgi:hypothetical protein